MQEQVEKLLTLQGDSWHIIESKHRELLIEGPVRTSKAEALSSIVYTPAGPKTMGDITVGDMVCTPDGNFAEVLEVHPQGKIQIYKITFNNGDTVRCCKDHLWYVQDQDRIKKKFRADSSKPVQLNLMILGANTNIRHPTDAHNGGTNLFSNAFSGKIVAIKKTQETIISD